MSYKPHRGTIGIDKTIEECRNYRNDFAIEMSKLNFEALKKASRYLYSWYIRECKLQSKTLSIEELITTNQYQCLLRNKEFLYKKLIPLL